MAWPNGTRLKSFVAGGSFLPGDANNIEDRMLQIAGYRGKSIITTEEARTNTAFGLLGTPDRVQNIVLPTDELLFIKFSALVKSSGSNTAEAAIFIGATQLKVDAGAGAPINSVSTTFGTTDDYEWLKTSPAASNGIGMATGVGNATRDTPLISGGTITVEVAAGTYDVSVQFKATSGSVTAKERKLWVWTMGFA